MTWGSAGFVTVRDLSDPWLAPYRDQRDQWLRARHRHWMEGREAPAGSTARGMSPDLPPELPLDLFMAEGAGVVGQLLNSPHRVVSALVSEARVETHRELLERVAAVAPVFVAPRGAVDALAGFDVHRGVMAVGQRADPGAWDEVAARSGLAVVLENLANHDNVGGIFRSTRALAGARAGFERPACVLLTRRCCDPLYRKALRVSMGNALHVPYAEVGDWPGALARLRGLGFVPVALDPAADAVDVSEVAGRFGAGSEERPAIILGTEGPGLQRETVEAVRACGGVVARIDIEAGADSLNVGVAGAIALRELGGRKQGAT